MADFETRNHVSRMHLDVPNEIFRPSIQGASTRRGAASQVSYTHTCMMLITETAISKQLLAMGGALVYF